MRKRILGFIVCWLIHTVCLAQGDSRFLDPEYWKKQALEQILPPWTLNAQDPQGGFYTNLDRQWKPDPEALKYPSMLSRHLFSYTAAFMLSGEQEYLTIADSIKNYLVLNGWDNQYGGWYDALTPQGRPSQDTKSTFVQVYAITGLVLYYAATHDNVAMDYILKSNQLLESKVWDSDEGGYYNQMHRDWTVKDAGKSFSSLVTPASGYLSYLYLSTRKAVYRWQAEKIMNTLMTKALDAETGWVRENFTREWDYLPAQSADQEINIGHNLEAAWMWLRLYRLNGREDYLEAAQRLSVNLAAQGFDGTSNMWSAYTSNGVGDPGNFTYWWIQAYGLMFDVFQFKTSAMEPFIRRFKSGAHYWESYVLDQDYGDTYFKIDHTGKALDATKGNAYKTAYHSMENALLLSWYLSLWVVQKPVKLYFYVPDQGGEIYYPVLVEDDRVIIKATKFEQGGSAKIIQRGRAFSTEPGQRGILEVVLR